MLNQILTLALIASAWAYREFIFIKKLFFLLKLFTADRSDRIVGGQNVALGQIPSQASLRNWGSTFHFAGGVLISDIWVLTSAQYMVGRADDSINIALGLVVLTGNFTDRRSDLIVIHEGYNFTTRENK